MMKKRTKFIFDGAENIAALVYLCSISAVMMYLLCREYIVICTIIMTALCGGIYMLFYALRNKRLITFVVFLALFGAVVLTCSTVTAMKGSIALIEFIYNTSDYFDLPLAAAAIFLFSFVVTYPVFYFTVKLPRPCFLLLSALAPLILGARTVGTLPAGFTAFLAAGYFVAVMGVSRAEYPEENIYVEDKTARRERLAAMGIFGVAVAVALLLIPRSDKTPYANYLDASRFTNTPFYGTQDMPGFLSGSSPNTGNNQVADNTLFYVTTDNPRNIISQSFDTYQGKNGWTYSDEFSMGYKNWRDERKLLNYNAVAANLKKGAEDGKLDDYSETFSKLPNIAPSDRSPSAMTIQVVDDSNTPVVRHPSGTYNAFISGQRDVDIYRNSKDEIFTKNKFGTKASYTLEFYGMPIDPDYARYFSGLDGLDYRVMLYNAVDNGVVDELTAQALINEQREAESYLNSVSDESITPKIQALADQITAGLDNDYDKAVAIEQWFGKAGFTYDLNFVPQELTAEYFLFTSKRGICTDFATATTLLLRAAGVPARYTVGFAIKTDPSHVDLYGRYEVKSEQSHAFSTVYIQGGGWMEIDGTKYANVASQSKELQKILFFAAIALGVIAILVIIFRKQVSELLFSIRYKFGSKKGKVRALYLRTRKIACLISETDPKATTTGEVRDVISRTLSLEKEVSEITDAADALLYGNADVAVDEKRLYKNYKLIRKAKRMRGK